MVDGDDTYPAESAFDLLKPLISGEADMCVGDRLSNGTYGQENDRAFHGFGNNLVRVLIKWIYGFKFSDVMTGYRSFNGLSVVQSRLRENHARSIARFRNRDRTIDSCGR